jgi:hypothetical protein
MAYPRVHDAQASGGLYPHPAEVIEKHTRTGIHPATRLCRSTFFEKEALFFLLSVFTHTKHTNHSLSRQTAAMTTTITMKLIMAVLVLMNFSGLVINMTSPRVNNESTNDFFYAKAPVSFPYNCTSNTQAKPTQAAERPLVMRQRPQPNAPAFFVERSPLEVRTPHKSALFGKSTRFSNFVISYFVI